MKKLVLTLAVAAAMGAAVQAQDCTPVPNACTPTSLIPACLAPEAGLCFVQGTAGNERADLFIAKAVSITSPLALTVPIRQVIVTAVDYVPAGLTMTICHAYDQANPGQTVCFDVNTDGTIPTGQGVMRRDDNDTRDFNVCATLTGTATTPTATTDSVIIRAQVYVGLTLPFAIPPTLTDVGEGTSLATLLADPTAGPILTSLGLSDQIDFEYKVSVNPTGQACTVSNDKALEFAANFRVYPNPTSAGVSAAYSLTEASDVRAEVFAADGRLVYSADLGRQLPGENSFDVPAERLTAGVYVISLNTGSVRISQKFVRN